MSRKKNHILSAIESIAQAHQELERTVSNHGKIIESQGKDIAALEQTAQFRLKLLMAFQPRMSQRSTALAPPGCLKLRLVETTTNHEGQRR